MQAAYDNWREIEAVAAEVEEYLKYPIVHEPPRENVSYQCPCCKYLTLKERGGYDICPVCYWEDDGQDDPYADQVRGGPNYHLSLTQARENFKAFGAVEERLREFARPPTEEELPS
nr:CPCC family cysteine-rich protein [Agrobacterium fabrum]